MTFQTRLNPPHQVSHNHLGGEAVKVRPHFESVSGSKSFIRQVNYCM